MHLTWKQENKMPSTVINKYSYDPEKQILYITFVSQLTYAYKGVPEHVFNMLKAAGSKGRYFNYFIKGKFKYNKLRNNRPNS